MAKKYDVIVVGAGMVGSLTGILLANKGMSVALIDKSHGAYPLSIPPAYDARVSAISQYSQSLFKEAGVWQKLDRSRLAPYRNMKVWDGLGCGAVDFESYANGLSELGHLVENAVLCEGLMSKVSETREIDTYFNDTIAQYQCSEDGVNVELDSAMQLDAQLIIAADGALSQLRQQSAFDTVEWDYGHHAVVTTVEIDAPHEDTAWQAFGEEGILAFLPLPSVDGRHYISIVWSVSPQEADSLMALDVSAFCNRLTYAINHKFTALDLTVSRVAIPLRQRHAKQYVKSGIALIGDAAHTIHPLAGQGANLGFADTGELVKLLANAHKRGEALGRLKTLRRYQRARMLDNIAMSASMETFKRVFSTNQPAIVQLRNMGMSLCQNSSFLKKKLVAHAAGLSTKA
ncbi:2-octaprenyl-3-methyl-6-methoxy-1,4-benzoquinol hydroxylase [Marinomonas mediterranea]|uniref:UbiH/UbiF/VisC/COQ6 family ubiquinone biosynthesis hydroxylase n=1 Tax=Marinomonas mediterranea TaxID=119864 RepID=UPI00234BF921|nr:UbiH/UbiF/VisC/COQ6 family ubiquinone biosynthesis hydroxylase [Marinomonas mediterranea]WCN12144.1 2-octaprenyl-3-methyl-6-methoxy-1,4-benzoquinol hydroxylase [Marinomonas mediterranea]